MRLPRRRTRTSRQGRRKARRAGMTIHRVNPVPQVEVVLEAAPEARAVPEAQAAQDRPEAPAVDPKSVKGENHHLGAQMVWCMGPFPRDRHTRPRTLASFHQRAQGPFRTRRSCGDVLRSCKMPNGRFARWTYSEATLPLLHWKSRRRHRVLQHPVFPPPRPLTCVRAPRHPLPP